MARVLKRPLALQDLDDIWFTIALDKPLAADRVLDEIGKAAGTYATQPRMGRARDELAPALRSFPVSRYLVFYFPLKDSIDIVRVLDAARDIPALASEGAFRE